MSLSGRRVVEPEAEPQLHLIVGNLAVGDVPADLGDLEPLHMAQGFRGPCDGALDGSSMPLSDDPTISSTL